jgi:hypothetical protein
MRRAKVTPKNVKDLAVESLALQRRVTRSKLMLQELDAVCSASSINAG